MPEERPENQSDPQPEAEAAPEDSQGQEAAGQSADQGAQPEDAASAALRAAREALSSIQAEADGAMKSKPATPPRPPAPAQTPAKPEGDDPQTVADEVVQAALRAAQQQGDGSAGPSPQASPAHSDAGTVPAGAKRLELPDFDLSQIDGVQHGLDMLADVQLDVRIELGRSRMLVEDVLRLSAGAVVELDKLAGDPLDVYVNDRLVARGEVLVLNDNFCIRINEIIDSVGEDAAQAAAH